MIILAGIDEAGLGPVIGPLATACAALAVPAAWTPDAPWEHLAGAVCRGWQKKETRTGVTDSKVIYRLAGLTGLELTVAAFALAAHGNPAPAVEYLGGDEPAGTLHPCYSLSLDPFPCRNDPAAIAAAATTLREALIAAGAEAAHLGVRLLFEPVLNRRYDDGLNKNEALLIETGSHLRALFARFPRTPVLAVVDKQGGRDDYLPFLARLFPGVWLDELEAGRARSVYRLRRAGASMEVRFQAKADRDSFATALASMAAKYARERAMAEVNAWFGARHEGLRDTAGYPGDAGRWLDEVRARPGEHHLHLLIRKR